MTKVYRQEADHRIFRFTAFRPAPGLSYFPVQCVPGVIPQRLRRPERETDNSAPSNGRMKDACSCIPYAFKALDVIKDKDILFYIFGASYKS